MWVPTYTGKRFDPFDPQPDQIDLLDIAHSLSQTNRYNGHTVRPYSVAEHSVRVSSLVPARVAALALLHDAAEAYIGDMVQPVKRRPEAEWYRNLDVEVSFAIYHKFGIDDHTICSTEVKMLSKVDLLIVNVEMDLAGLHLHADAKPSCEEDTIHSDMDADFCDWMFKTTNHRDGSHWGWNPVTAEEKFLNRARFLGLGQYLIRETVLHK